MDAAMNPVLLRRDEKNVLRLLPADSIQVPMKR